MGLGHGRAGQLRADLDDRPLIGGAFGSKGMIAVEAAVAIGAMALGGRSNGSRIAWRTSSGPTRGEASKPTSKSAPRCGRADPRGEGGILADLGYLLPTTAVSARHDRDADDRLLRRHCGGGLVRGARTDKVPHSVRRRRPTRGGVLPRADRRSRGCEMPAQPDPPMQRAGLDVRRLRAVPGSCGRTARPERGPLVGTGVAMCWRQLGERASGRVRADA